MAFDGSIPLGFVGLVSLAMIAGCVNKTDHLPYFHDISNGSAVIQTAAKAVVRVETAGETATASFISSSGLLLTNSHVLGATVCPIEGCYVRVSLMHQIGEPRQTPTVLYAVPVAVDVGLDMAVVQLHRGPTSMLFESPDFLSFDAKDPASLLRAHVTVIGHPEGRLKKWTDGVVYDVSGNWIKSTAYILPGDSGSPMLDDAGKIVGLVHRSPTTQDLITRDGVNEYSVGTASAPIVNAMTAPLPSTVISLAAATTRESVVTNNHIYLNAHATMALVDGESVSVLSLLAQACDVALARQDFQSPNDLADALYPCDDAITWIDCRADASIVSYGVVCPSAVDFTAWMDRFQAMNQRWRSINGQLDLYPVSFGIAHLAGSMSEGTYTGGQSLQQALSEAQPILDFTLANYLAAFEVQSYGGISIVDYIRDYKKIRHYEYQAFYIASAAAWLYDTHAMDAKSVLSILSQLHGNPNVDIESKLYIEELQY